MTTDKNIPESKKLRVQLELILDAVETDESIEVIHSTANIEGSPELTTDQCLSLLDFAVDNIREQATRAGKIYAHLAEDPDSAETLTL